MNMSIDPRNMDESVSPCKSFYQYVNGGWLASSKIPEDFSSWNAFRELDEQSKEHLKVIFDELVEQPIGSSLIAELYLSGMDTEAIEASGLDGIQDLLLKIDEIDSYDQIVQFVGLMHKNDIGNVFWYIGASADAKRSDWTILCQGQSGLGLPDREYYSDESKKEICDKYKIHIQKLFSLSGSDQNSALKEAEAVFDFETRIAAFSLSQEDRRDPVKTYNKVARSVLQDMCSSINWDVYFTELGLTHEFGEINLENIEYFTRLSDLLKSTSFDIIRAYLKYHLLNFASPHLPEEWVNEHFNFNETILNGTLKIQPRWKRVLNNVSDLLQDLVSQLYVAKHFSPESKTAALDMIGYIVKAFENRINSVDWLQDETRIKGLEKLTKFRTKIGYPDKWIDYSALNEKIVRSNSYLSNVRLALQEQFKRDIAKVNKAVDKSEWLMAPFMVNAYFHPVLNEIVFPAAILQPPFFYAPTKESPLGEPAMNFGAIGGVIAHEITHGYDDSGRRYDASGNLVDWWTKQDSDNFDRRAEKIIAQFDKFEVIGKRVNGKLTQGENIADMGGLSVSYAAFQEYLNVNNLEPATHKFNQEQMFFISWAQVWRNLIREKDAHQRLITDPHAPGEFRVDGPLSNLPAFHKAFGVQHGDPMFALEEDRVDIW